MKKFKVMVSFEAPGPSGLEMIFNPFQRSWGAGHLWSFISPAGEGQHEVAVCALVAAGSPDEACRAITMRVSGLVGAPVQRKAVWVRRVSPWRRAGRSGSAPDGDGDDGLAGDREPRMPIPPWGHLQAERRARELSILDLGTRGSRKPLA